ncbi:MAG: tetratricopeptide repeat protein, partial [Alphaproteobacteria bacterium]|nr:tetratricopeptide repeat protein [Alphaproteobacteria bacterium]
MTLRFASRPASQAVQVPSRLALTAMVALGVLLPVLTPAMARPSDSSGSYLAGQHAYRAGDFTAAADYMSRALAADPDNQPLLRRVLVLQVAEGRIASLSSLAQRVARTNPEDPVAALLLALDSARATDYAAAIATIDPIDPRGLGRFVRPLILAWLHLGKGDIAGAESALNSLAGDPNLSLLKDFHTGLIMDLAGRPDQAEAAFERTVALVQAPPLRLVQALGSAYERAGKTEMARNLYTDYLGRQGEDERVLGWLARVNGKAPGAAKPVPLAKTPIEGLSEAL